MASWLIVSRYILFALFMSFDAILCCISVWNISTVNTVLQFRFNADIYLIFTSSLSLFFLLPALIADFFNKNVITSRVGVELVWVFVLFVMQLSGAAAFTAESPRALCNDPPRPNTLLVCTSTKVVIAFAWLSTITLLIYFFMLLTSALLHAYSYPAYRMPLYHDSYLEGPTLHPCYAESIWRTGVRDFPWFKYRNLSASSAVRNGPAMAQISSWENYRIGGKMSGGGGYAGARDNTRVAGTGTSGKYQFGQFTRAATLRLAGQGASHAGRVRLSSTDDTANPPLLPSAPPQARTSMGQRPSMDSYSQDPEQQSRPVLSPRPRPHKHKLRVKEDRLSRSLSQDLSGSPPVIAPIARRMSRSNFEDVPSVSVPGSMMYSGAGTGPAMQERKHSQELYRQPLPPAPAIIPSQPRRYSITNPDPDPSSFIRPNPSVIERPPSETYAIPSHPYSYAKEPSRTTQLSHRHIVPPSELSRAIAPGSRPNSQEQSPPQSQLQSRQSHPYATAAPPPSGQAGKQVRPLPRTPGTIVPSTSVIAQPPPTVVQATSSRMDEKRRIIEEDQRMRMERMQDLREEELAKETRRRERQRRKREERDRERRAEQNRRDHGLPSATSSMNNGSRKLTAEALAEHTSTTSPVKITAVTLEYIERARLERSTRRVPVPLIGDREATLRPSASAHTFGASGDIGLSPVPSNTRQSRKPKGGSSRRETLLA